MPTRCRLALAAASIVALGGLGLSGIASADADTVKLDARLTGAQEVPVPPDGPKDPDANGRAKVALDVEDGKACFDVRFRDAGTANRGHIHSGPAGFNGPIVVAFFDLETAASRADPRHEELEQGGLRGCVDAPTETLAAIAANPDLYYVNLHNARFPTGVMRCQLEA